ncbi:hypothetical protein SAMN02745131_04107 [Flavisolibacter ginsengisoli DSM 18119]|uniref:Uncharacterized protein n=1 Tax=Flavisolibacter ginsengisoli DSM 18119 TaxID=1121884 RepID=A0A1M5GC92_9BACT|nr:hypothetical protein SAMN02745131_04107 [Flavisolibacter ginsengisoli DSM 18119]
MLLNRFLADEQLACYLLVAAPAGYPFHNLLLPVGEHRTFLFDYYCHATVSKIKFNSICSLNDYLFMGIFYAQGSIIVPYFIKALRLRMET